MFNEFYSLILDYELKYLYFILLKYMNYILLKILNPVNTIIYNNYLNILKSY